MLSLLARTHDKLIFQRRASRLVYNLAQVVPQNARILDVGCGDGSVSSKLMNLRKDISLSGIDTMQRNNSRIATEVFDGKHIPYSNGAFDYAMFVDVLHHTTDPVTLMKEALRVCPKGIIIKDHLVEGFLAYQILCVMDYVGNAPHGVVLPYNYFTRTQWLVAFDELGLQASEWLDQLGLYPPMIEIIFERRLHFVARLIPRSPSSN